MTTHDIRSEIAELKKRLQARRLARKSAAEPRSPADVPSRTDEGRFLPSTNVAYQLLETAERSKFADVASGEEQRTEEYTVPEAAERVRHIISATLDRVLYTQARGAAAHGRTKTTIATPSGKFADGIASLLAQQLSLNPYEAPGFLRALHGELVEVMEEGPITYSWGKLSYDKPSVNLTTAAPAKRLERTSPRAKFYRDIADL
jgi:hypothetical protein